MDRDEIGRKVMETSQVCREGYLRNISQFNTASENATAESCANAASNTGYFTLQALGFSTEEIRVMRGAWEEQRRTAADGQTVPDSQ